MKESGRLRQWLYSRSQERVDRNSVRRCKKRERRIPARKSGWIEISQESRRRKSNNSRSQERVDRNWRNYQVGDFKDSRSQERVDRNALYRV